LQAPQRCGASVRVVQTFTHNPRRLKGTVKLELEKSLMRSFSAGNWLNAHHNILITGPTGVGKSYIACALGNFACRQGRTTRYFRTSRIMSELAMARGDGSFQRVLSKLAKTEVLILDDFGLSPLTSNQCTDLMEVIDDRTNAVTIIASRLPIENWYATFEDPTTADAILDRLVHNAYKIRLTGESMRKIRGFLTEDSAETRE
ncbi:ATP-binding protein, partial [Alicyclobacillus macrosporangiidus]|uniref:ATP-binding protein n=1 Tax=Alicyclobacillus macrosporangiidus TaxID=392015 RepID=UPI001C314C58